ncbi:MAG TPA: hypothetical protein VNV60_04400 [Holophagaceae bacterium]|jgi:hypothetical protein|nr:hypothetical protein [Holophagaceae bacterium]
MKTRSYLLAAAALTAAFGLSFPVAAQDSHTGPPEIIKHRPNDQAVGGSAPTAGSTSKLKNPLSYHGGAVLSTPTVYLIWYGNWAQSNGTDDAGGQQIVTDFFHSLGGSPYYQINTTYIGSANAISGNVTYGGASTTGYTYGSALSDANIQQIVGDAINGGLGPAGGDTNGIYFVLTSSDVNESSGFCTQYCGWHTHGTLSGRDIKYAFVGNAARCITACAAQSISPNGNAGVDGMVSVLAHECEEADTDADLNAWYNRRGSENGDLCAWTFGTSYQVSNGSYANMKLGTRDFLIQRNVDIQSTGQYCTLSK